MTVGDRGRKGEYKGAAIGKGRIGVNGGGTMAAFQTILRLGVLGGAALAAAACAQKRTDKAEIEIRGGDSTAPARRVAQADEPGDGFRDYGDYRVAIAREGETVAGMARRIGLSSVELGAYNGLTPDHVLKSGDELALPPQPEGYETPDGATGGLSEPTGDAAIVAAPLGDVGLSVEEPGEASAEDGLWSPDIAARAIARATGTDETGNLELPPSSASPLPAAPKEPEPLQSPNLEQYRTEPQARPGPAAGAEDGVRVATVTSEPAPTTSAVQSAAGGARFQRPVQGPVAIRYGEGVGRARNDGVDFASAPGAPVVAAADGEVALVSESLGNLGTIMLLRHADGLLTVYGRITDVALTRGAQVVRGQQIGRVATPPAGEEGRMHFEVRRGADSLDPAPFLGG